ncbi:hypothetical protein [Subtercola endophyticus]|uniref:hypothetical protein n=1 Tax=Subtercola endophyticus TaxID=2895559 RepID=UPI0028BDB9E4|nr:hypothetical protein [Subtercola endophyticus]
MAERLTHERFSGRIAGFGTAGSGSQDGPRIVIGMWVRSPFGRFADVMIEHPDGRRVLLAPSDRVATYVSSTYTFDEVRVVPVRAMRVAGGIRVMAGATASGTGGAGLGGEGLGGAAPDGAALDGTALGGTRLDGTAPDDAGLGRAGLDGTVPDGTGLQGTRLDGTVPDGAVPDGTALGGTRLDGTVPDGAVLDVTMRVGRITPLGRVLRGVPERLATDPRWLRAVDPVAARLVPGAHTSGSAGGGRREYYGVTTIRALDAVHGTLEGRDLSSLAPLDPPVTFGFGSAPATPSLVDLTTIIRSPRPHPQ